MPARPTTTSSRTARSVDPGSRQPRGPLDDRWRGDAVHSGDIKETYGVPVEEIVRDIRSGVRKVNIDTDIRLAMTGAMRRLFATHPSEFDPRKAMLAAKKAARGICKQRFEAFGCAGQAGKIKPVPLEAMTNRYR